MTTFVFACRINLLKELREDQMIKQFENEPVTTWEPDGPLIEIPKNCEGPPCGECHLKPGELCDICGRTAPLPLQASSPAAGDRT